VIPTFKQWLFEYNVFLGGPIQALYMRGVHHNLEKRAMQAAFARE